MKHEKFKVTPLERAGSLYDVGNSAFVLMIATLVPIFFNALAEAGGLSSVDYLAYWGYASSVVTVITAVLGPILGTLADTRGFKKPIFMLCACTKLYNHNSCNSMNTLSSENLLAKFPLQPTLLHQLHF